MSQANPAHFGPAGAPPRRGDGPLGRVRCASGPVSVTGTGRATGWPWLSCNDKPAPPPCIARLVVQVAEGRHSSAEAARCLQAAQGAVQRSAIADLAEAYGCGVSTWAALDLAPHAEAHEFHEAVLAMRRRYGVPYAASIRFRSGVPPW